MASIQQMILMGKTLNEQPFTITQVVKFLAIFIVVIGAYLRFFHIDDKVFNADEVRSFYRLSGYTREEVVSEIFTGDIISTADLQRYQQPTLERSVGDAIHALSKNPEHPPLFYLIARFFIDTFNSPLAARIVTISFGLLALGGLYWICIELFDSPTVGWIAVALGAVSPYQILISQGAREYSLWMLVTTLSCAMLLRSLRLKTPQNWLIYAVTVSAGLYSHLFFIFSVISHGIYVGLSERFRLTKSVVSYGIATVLGFLGFIPWILVILANQGELEEKTQWVRESSSSLKAIILGNIGNIGDIFLDLNNRTKIEQYLAYLIVALVIYAFYVLLRQAPTKTGLLVLIITVVGLSGQILPDVIAQQGIRSLQSRYFITPYLGIFIAIAYLIAHNLTSNNRKQKSIGSALFLIFLLFGITSGVLISQSRDWDYLEQQGTASSRNLELAPLINAAAQPLVISEATHSFVLALSYLTDEKVKFQLFQDSDPQEWSAKINLSAATKTFSDVFLYFPDETFLNAVKAPGFQVEALEKELYKVVPTS